MAWKYWNRHPDWEGSRGFVMERGGAIVAHGAVVPLRYMLANQHLRIVHLIDWAATRDCTGAGIALMRRVGEMTDGVFAAGGSESTQKILPALGFKSVGTAARYILPSRPLARMGNSLRSWRGAARFGRGLFLSLTAHPTEPLHQGWSARRLQSGELSATHVPTPRPCGKQAAFARTHESIVDLLQCPIAPGELYVVERNGTDLGYFVLTIAGMQCRLAEAWIESENPDDWQALFTLAIRQAKTYRQVAELIAVASTRLEKDALERTGLPCCGHINLRLWMRNERVPEAIRFQMVDGDAAYLHDGS